jgi:hypothetical protein
MVAIFIYFKFIDIDKAKINKFEINSLRVNEVNLCI